MNELVTSALAAGDVTSLIEFPSFLMNEFEQQVITFIAKYVKTYGSIPSVERVRKEFPHFIPLQSDPPLPLLDLVDLTLKRKRVEFASSKLGDVLMEMRDEGDVPMSKITDIIASLNATNGELARYSSFSRELYFRTGRNLKLGFPIIDRLIGGFFNGDYFLVAGRLGAGKSTVLQVIAHKWWEEGRKVLYISKEMLPVDVFSRIDGMVGKFNPIRIRNSSKSEMMPTLNIVSSIAGKSSGEIVIPNRQITKPSQIATLAQYLNMDAIIVDGVYLMEPDVKISAKWEAVASISNELKQIAMSLQSPLLASTQIKRVGAKEEYDPEDLAYSDALGQDADFILTIHPTIADKHRLELQLIKNRFGDQGGTVVYMDHERMNMVDESTEGEFSKDYKEGWPK